MRASTNSLELSWGSIPNAQYYLLEVQKLPVQLPAEKIKEEIKEPVTTPQKFVYQPSTAAAAGDKKPMLVFQQAKKPIQLSAATSIPTVRSPSVIKVNQPIKVLNKTVTSIAGGTIQVQRPLMAGNVIKLMPGTIFSGNKIIMKPATTQSSQQQIIVGTNMIRPTFTTAQAGIRPAGQQIKIMTQGGVAQQSRPITIGGKTVTLQLAGQKKVTLVGNSQVRTGTPQKIIMMPSGSIVTSTASTVTKTPQQPPPKIEQLDGAVDDQPMDDDIENQISTVKIEKQTADEVKVTSKIEDNEAAAILSTISEQNLLTSHSVNTVIPLHDEKALRNSLNQNLLASPIIGNDFNGGDSSLDALAAAALEASSKNSVNLSASLSNEANGGVCKLEKTDENEKWMLVGVFKTLTQNVSHYVDYQWEEQTESLTSESLPDLSLLEKIPLEQGRAYRFRIAGVNACGVGKFSEVSLNMINMIELNC